VVSSQLSAKIGPKEMNKKIFIWLLATILLTTVSVAEAQQPTKIPRIGYLIVAFPSTAPARTEAFRQGLRELGYVEGKNIVIEYRYAEERLTNWLALRRNSCVSR
jgi:putative ABC transport system substrate-binding protein